MRKLRACRLGRSTQLLGGWGIAVPIAREDGFLVTHDLAHVTCLGVESDRLNECIARVKMDRTKGVFGYPHFGFNGTDLDFLAQMRWLEAVWFWGIDLKSIEGLYSLSGLRHFGVHPKRPPIDFSRFSHLRKVVIHPRPRDCGLGSLPGLELLHVWHFRPKDKNFASLEFPHSLVELQINWANPASLDSLPFLPNLRCLEVHRCRNLQNLGDIGAKFPRLERLIVAACGNLSDGEAERVVQGLPNLSFVHVQGTTYKRPAA